MVNNRQVTPNFTRPTVEEVKNNNASRHRYRWSVQEQQDLVYLKENEEWSNEEIAAFFNRSGLAITAKYRSIKANGMTSESSNRGAGRVTESSEDNDNVRMTRSSERRDFERLRKTTQAASSSMNGKEKELEEKEKSLEARERSLEEKEKSSQDTKAMVYRLENRIKEIEKILQEISEKYMI
ncbi:hypothetical protein INT45_000335 [Circinella minor]|uniref:Uncharacterized protein n=1 Tax=Circinella minor TaxID=1195481 RepID=A0A8H7VJI5_9FUNG|nr:hypothetical protein INT45_000335 [Circinella minor]